VRDISTRLSRGKSTPAILAKTGSPPNLSLNLFMLGVLANNHNLTMSLDDFALFTHWLY
jgi:hypothetical protein